MQEKVRIEGALFEINAHYDSLSDSEKKVASYVLREPKKTLHFNVRELSKQSGSSQAAVIRFCKHLNFSSFSNFKIRLARDVFDNYDERYVPDLELESETAPAAVIHSVIQRLQQSFTALERTLDGDSLEQAVNAILSARSTALFGVGASGVVAFDFMQKLVRLGLPVFYTHDTDLQLTAASTLKQQDCAFIISYSGENDSMKAAAEQLRKNKVPIISLTMDSDNTIRRLSSIHIPVPASERIYRQGASTSRINQLAVIDMLYSLMVSKNLDASIEAIEQTMAATHRHTH
ncbi:MAG: MurR/RpiR family transcriptional regulator [Sphaerochaeta sp.]|jgi:DNA-binding MurR/RpiR family transcriptional regulator|uniref:MurR/RpiR family transcriptional regulator n=1 Tax=unclassified Sphaerochaeta TaxID=2637943 RepID=UPI0025E4C8AC|nr:MurR/RpiR family transcriptional regulator [Sphaerochaeta sp. UBA5856]